MFIPRVYYPHPLQCDEKIVFDKEKSHYLTNVLRLKMDEPLILFNGQGGEYQAKIGHDKKQTYATVLSFNPIARESFLSIHLGLGLTRGDRMDIVIQKATELGVKFITPLFTKHAFKLDNDRLNKRLAHWQNITISACEQCGRTQLPIISPPTILVNWVQQPFEGVSVLLEPTANETLKTLSNSKAIRLAIGPESGWVEHEMLLMKQNHFICTSLGPRILRAETASIAAISLIQGLFGDL